MKNIYYLFIFILFTTFTFSFQNSGIDNPNGDPFNLVPNLPEYAYSYQAEFPRHFEETDFTGWLQAPFDFSQLDFLDDDKATLGRVLFYDEILSKDRNISCASCHLQSFSFADTVALSMGTVKETKRNSLHLNDLGWSNNGGLFWDMSQHSLQELVSLPLADENEIGLVDFEDIKQRMLSTSYYSELFGKAFETDKIWESRVAEALEHFILSMTTFNSKLDSVKLDLAQFTEQERNGLQIFEESCLECHVERSFPMDGIEDFKNHSWPRFFFKNDVLSKQDRGIGNWKTGFSDHFKIPSLRNVEVTAPYMHDGRFANLEDVIDHYSDSFFISNSGWIPDRGFQFSDDEKSELLAFLKTKTDKTFLTDVRWSDPFVNDELEFNKHLVISEGPSPNPASTYSVVKFDNERQEPIWIYVRDEVGSLMQKHFVHTEFVYLNVDDFPDGIYYVTIYSHFTKETKKLVVMK